MTTWSRRDVLRTGAGAAAAVPMAMASGVLPAAGLAEAPGLTASEASAAAAQPVMFSIHDAHRGEVAIYHGRRERVITDPALVARIVRAARDDAAQAGR